MWALILCLQSTPSTMPPDSWLTIPDSRMRAVAPTNGQFPGTWGVGGPAMVIAAWGGGALDTKRSRLILWGGGHADYYGNELYAFDIPSLKWSRLTDPTPNPVMDQEVNADGTPNSRHTYGGLGYIAHADRFFGQGGSLAGVGFARCDKTWTFDFDAKKWTDRQPATSSGGGLGVTCAYDPATKKLWWGGAGLWSYDYDANTWTKHSADEFYYNTSAFDTQRGHLVVAGNGALFAYDVRGQNYAKQAWPAGPAAALIAKGNIGFDYDPVADRFVAWSGGSPYLLDPATKTWTIGSSTGAAPEGQNGVYGRWRYVPSVNAFIVVTGIDTEVRFYKASAGAPAPPPAPAPPAPAPPAPPSGSGAAAPSSLGDDNPTETCGCGAIRDTSGWWSIALLLGILAGSANRAA